MDTIKTQANKVSELVFSADTGATYRKTVILTLNILRETGILLWLVICFVFVGGEWFWKNSIRLGSKARSWYDGLQTQSAEESKSASEMGQSALTAIKSSTETLLYKAKQQLGIEATPPASKPDVPQPVVQTPEPEPTVPAPAKSFSEQETPADPTIADAPKDLETEQPDTKA